MHTINTNTSTHNMRMQLDSLEHKRLWAQAQVRAAQNRVSALDELIGLLTAAIVESERQRA
jgi:hypothetical protein